MPGEKIHSQKVKVTKAKKTVAKAKETSKPSMPRASRTQKPITDKPEGYVDASTTNFSPEEREKLIAKAAYFRAEKRGFSPGCELEDWIEAEAEVSRLIGQA